MFNDKRMGRCSNLDFSIRVSLLLVGLWASLAASAAPAPAGAERDTPGIPWKGQPGVSETVDQIMAREAQHPKTFQSERPIQTHRRIVRTVPRLDNPLAPATASWHSPIFSPSQDREPRPLLPQVVGTSFLGAQFSDTPGYIPPDSMGNVGPTQVMVIVNGRIRIFSKTGT